MKNGQFVSFSLLPLPPPLSSVGCSNLHPGPSGVPSSVDFHRRLVPTTFTPESFVHAYHVFVQVDCRCSERPSILFSHVLDGVCGGGRVRRICGGRVGKRVECLKAEEMLS